MARSHDAPIEMHRPAIFALLFWSALITALSVWAIDVPELGRPFGAPLLAVATLALIATWFEMPWNPAVSGPRKATVAAFLATSFVFCLGTFFLWALPLYAIAVANGIFLFGFRRGTALSAATPPLVFIGAYLFSPVTPGEMGIGGAAFFAVLMVPVAAFVIGICTALVDALRSRQHAHHLLADLEAANTTLRHQSERIRELAIAEERTRLAREMHDTLGHYLTAINLQLQNAERFEERDPARSRQKVREARESTLAALAEVRRSVRAMKPDALEAGSGAAALRALVQSFDGMAFAATFELQGEERRLPDDVELALYRATQEGLTNAARHADAGKVHVTLTFGDRTTRLDIRDDGRGACDEALEGGFGLAELRDRIAVLGGTLSARNDAASGGFALEATLPAGPRQGQGVGK